MDGQLLSIQLDCMYNLLIQMVSCERVEGLRSYGTEGPNPYMKILREIQALEEKVAGVTFDKKKDSLSGWKYIKHDQTDNGWVALFQRRSSYRPYIVRFEASEYMPSSNEFRSQFKSNVEGHRDLASAERAYDYWRGKIDSLKSVS